jgi:hypothetical protein
MSVAAQHYGVTLRTRSRLHSTRSSDERDDTSHIRVIRRVSDLTTEAWMTWKYLHTLLDGDVFRVKPTLASRPEDNRLFNTHEERYRSKDHRARVSKCTASASRSVPVKPATRPIRTRIVTRPTVSLFPSNCRTGVK